MYSSLLINEYEWKYMQYIPLQEVNQQNVICIFVWGIFILYTSLTPAIAIALHVAVAPLLLYCMHVTHNALVYSYIL